MTVLGGHKRHDKGKQKYKKKHREAMYSKDDDIAWQMRAVKTVKNYCQLPANYFNKVQPGDSFMTTFLKYFS